MMTPSATTQLLLYVVNLATVTFPSGLVDSNGVSKAITALILLMFGAMVIYGVRALTRRVIIAAIMRMFFSFVGKVSSLYSIRQVVSCHNIRYSIVIRLGEISVSNFKHKERFKFSQT